MLQALARLRPSTSTPVAACARCRSLHASGSQQWRTREERREALHRKDDRYEATDGSRGREKLSTLRQKVQYARPSYPRRTQTPGSGGSERRPPPEQQYKPQRNPFQKTRTRTDRRNSLGVFSGSSKGASKTEYPAGFERPKQQSGLSNLDRLKQESRDKTKSSINLAKELPPLTDEDYKTMYQELLTYDSAPPSPTQRRLAMSPPSTIAMLGPASQAARDRIAELRERLSRRVILAVGEATKSAARQSSEEGESLHALLSKMRQAQSSASEGPEPAPSTQPHLLNEATQSLVENDSAWEQTSPEVPIGRRQHAQDRREALYAMSRLLQPTPGTEHIPRKLLIGSEDAEDRLDIASKQEWAALVLEAANDRNLAETISGLDLMRRAGIAVSEDLLVSATRLISRDDRLTPIFLRYFEQEEIMLPPAVHHEVVLGVLKQADSPTPSTKAERYLRGLEVANTPAPPQTYAAVIRHIFKQRHQTGLRGLAWDLYGHMRLVAHPTPSIEVFDAMIYGCSLDDRVAPERALDLFAELAELGLEPSYETYLGLIRTCAKDKSEGSPYYHEALRLLKELLGRGFEPECDIFICILEGARRRGELGRAKWIIANMLQIAARAPEPSRAPIAPNVTVFQNLFLAAATYKPKFAGRCANKISNITEVLAREQENNDAITTESQQGTVASKAARETAPKAIETGDETVSSGIDAGAERVEEEHNESDQEPGNASSPVAPQIQTLHPLLRVGAPQTAGQLLQDMQCIMGTILEVNDFDATFLLSASDRKASAGTWIDASAPASQNEQKTASVSTSRRTVDFVEGLDAATRDALRAVKLTNALFNAYLSFLSAHGKSDDVVHFFRSAYNRTDLNVKRSNKTWEIVFDALDSKRTLRSGDRASLRQEQATTARELFEQWRSWIASLSMNREEHHERFRASRPEASPLPPKHSPPWLDRHMEVMYARAMGVQVRAGELDQAMDLVREFAERFPAENITQAAQSWKGGKDGALPPALLKDKQGPAYLVKLSSALYPETSEGSFGKSSAKSLTGGPAPNAPFGKGGATSSNSLMGVPPLVSYQMVYPLFHRLRELEDKRAEEILDILLGYRDALNELAEARLHAERKEVLSGKDGRSTRREIIGQPGSTPRKAPYARMSGLLTENDQVQRGQALLDDGAAEASKSAA